MRTVEISETDFKDLNTQMFTMYKFFSKIAAGVENEDKRSNTPMESLRVEKYPWQTYSFRFLDTQLSIHRLRNGHFTLDAHNLNLSMYELNPLFKRKDTSWRYQKYYGDFQSLDTAVHAFCSVVKRFVDTSLGALF